MEKRIDIKRSDLQYAPLQMHIQGLQQTASGYGKRLKTPYKIWHNNKSYRVYCCCYSNAGTLYIEGVGGKIILDVIGD